MVFLRAKELPRGALVEFQVNLHTGRRDMMVESESFRQTIEQEDSDDEDDLEAIFSQADDGHVRIERCATSGQRGRGFRQIVCVRGSSRIRSWGLELTTRRI